MICNTFRMAPIPECHSKKCLATRCLSRGTHLTSAMEVLCKTPRCDAQNTIPAVLMDEPKGPPTPVPSPEPTCNELEDESLRAWLVAFGGACNIFTTFGYVSAWGVFQSYYQETLLKDQPPSNIAWIGSTQYSLIFFPGLLVGRLFDLGYFRIPMLIASVIMVAATVLTAHCTKFWHFLLCQGILFGVGAGMVVGPSISVTSHWFVKRKGTALGLQALGSSIGGVVFPIMIRNLITSIGFKRTMYLTGLVLALSTGCSNLTMRRRFPPDQTSGCLFTLRPWRDRPAYAVYCGSTFFAFLGLWTVLMYIDLSGTVSGLAPEFSFYLVAIINGAGGFGRYFGGCISDYIGSLNTMVPFVFISALTTYIWPFATTKATLIAIAVVYGFSSGVYMATMPAPVFSMGPVEETGRRLGMLMTLLAFGALGGPPISGTIFARTKQFHEVGYYAGGCILVSCALMLLTKRLELGPKLWLKAKY